MTAAPAQLPLIPPVPASTPTPRRHAVHAMGTRFEFLAYHEDVALAQAALEEAGEEVLRLHRLWSAFDPASTISRINRSAGEVVRVDRDTLELLVHALRLWRETGGLFDPTVGALMRWWGFRGPGGGREREEPLPKWGMGHIKLDEGNATVRLAEPGLQLDLGAIGKGAALDAAGAILREAGVGSALIHGGSSSVLAIGAPPGQVGWRVAVGEGDVAPVVSLRDEALGVSMPSGRTIAAESAEMPAIPGVPAVAPGLAGETAVFEPQAATLGHLLDPRTGHPAKTGTLAAVILESARDADAWSTAALIAGEVPRACAARWAYVLPTP